MTQRTALVAGATGAASSRLVEVLLAEGWRVVGLCRNPPESSHPQLAYVRTDLLDAQSVTAAVAAHPGITHAFYCSRAPFNDKLGGVEDVAGNVGMLASLLDALEAHARALEHVHLVEGAKWYGVHLGGCLSPAREDDPRHMPPNFYYDQEDLLCARQKGKAWTWSASRPNFIYDFAPQRARNIVSTMGVWCAICREMGMDLEYPGSPGAFAALAEQTDATHYARAMAFMATSPAAANQAFNITDGGPMRWQRFWPRLADFFGMKPGRVRPMKLGLWMADKAPVWDAIVKRHGLAPTQMDDLAVWPFADFFWNQDFDLVLNTMKLRKAGFADGVDTEDQLLAHLARYREAKLLP